MMKEIFKIKTNILAEIKYYVRKTITFPFKVIKWIPYLWKDDDFLFGDELLALLKFKLKDNLNTLSKRSG